MRTISRVRTDFIDFLRLAFAGGLVKANGQTLFRYDPADETVSNLIISGSNVTNPNRLNKEPAILVSRGDVKPEKNTKSLQDSLLEHNWETGYSTHAYVMNCPIIMNCICPNDNEAETLAQLAYILIEKNMPYIRRKFKYRQVDLGGIGNPRILKYEGDGTNVQAWSCGILADVKFHFAYKTKQVEEGLNMLDFRFSDVPITWIDQGE